MRPGYKPRACDFGIFGFPNPFGGGPAFLGIPVAAIDVKEEAAAAILARLKGSYKVAPSQVFEKGANGELIAIGMVNSAQQLAEETLNPAGMPAGINTSFARRESKEAKDVSPFNYRAYWAAKDPPIHSYTSVDINDDGMCFSGGRNSFQSGGVDTDGGNGYNFVDNSPGTWKLTLRRGGAGELYLDNLGSRIIEETTAELKIKMYQGGEIVLVRN